MALGSCAEEGAKAESKATGLKNSLFVSILMNNPILYLIQGLKIIGYPPLVAAFVFVAFCGRILYLFFGSGLSLWVAVEKFGKCPDPATWKLFVCIRGLYFNGNVYVNIQACERTT